MYVLDVIPIARSAGKESLSYLSKEKVPLGYLVEVPLRRQMISALVLSCQKAENIKSAIRTSDFQFKKVSIVHKHPTLSRQFVGAIGKTAEHFATYTGQLLFALTPKHVLSQDIRRKMLKQTDIKKMSKWQVIQAEDEDRFVQYKQLIRSSLNKKQSVFLCVPSRRDGEHFFEFIRKGIEEYVFHFHSGLTKKQIQEKQQEVLDDKHPVVIIGTPMFLSIPRVDVGKIILDRESSEGYRTIGNPKIDTRIFVEYFSKEIKAELIFGDTFLRLETIYRHQEKKIGAIQPVSFRTLTPANSVLFDMTEENAPLVFDAYADKIIRLTKEKNEHTFVFAARKGLHSITVCKDCGHIVTSSDGSAPMVLYEHPDGNYFYSPHTKEKRPADDTCLYCGGWRLNPLGLGIDTIEKEVHSIASDTKIFRLDKDSVSTHKKALSVTEEFYGTPGSIMIGTEFSLAYLREPIDNCIITTIDSLLALPDFRIQEKILRTLLSFRSKALKNFVIQTRNPDQQLFNYATKGNSEKFIIDELVAREKFRFPPFSVLIKITLQGEQSLIEKHAREITEYLNEAEADIYPAHISKIRGSWILNILLRIPKENWPNHTLSNKLRTLSPTYRVQVDPENIL